ncbi:MAG: Mur ligase family protein [Brevinematia bacterium]
MNYKESIDYIYSLTNFENSRKFRQIEGFQNVKLSLDLLGVEYNKKNIIHIAGTKGKGTVAYFSSFLLSKFAQTKVGLFTSPHLVKVNERISVFSNGIEENISDEDFASLASEVREFLERSSIPLTTFDFLTVMAMVYFHKANVDNVVLEVGLGGRLDSTNFCNPKVSVITLIDYDHTNVLGRSLKKIATEKAGIIKPSVPVVSSYQKATARNVILQKALSSHSRVVFIDEVYKILSTKTSLEGTASTVKHLPSGVIFSVNSKMIGEQFIENILLSYEAVNILYPLDRSVLSNTDFTIKGRFEVISKEPFVVFDVAHTPKSVDKLISNYASLLGKQTFSIIVGLMKDKELKKISMVLSKYMSSIRKIEIIEIEAKGSSQRLSKYLKRFGFSNIRVVKDVRDICIENENYLIFGSFRIYKDILQTFKNT